MPRRGGAAGARAATRQGGGCCSPVGRGLSWRCPHFVGRFPSSAGGSRTRGQVLAVWPPSGGRIPPRPGMHGRAAVQPAARGRTSRFAILSHNAPVQTVLRPCRACGSSATRRNDAATVPRGPCAGRWHSSGGAGHATHRREARVATGKHLRRSVPRARSHRAGARRRSLDPPSTADTEDSITRAAVPPPDVSPCRSCTATGRRAPGVVMLQG